MAETKAEQDGHRAKDLPCAAEKMERSRPKEVESRPNFARKHLNPALMLLQKSPTAEIFSNRSRPHRRPATLSRDLPALIAMSGIRGFERRSQKSGQRGDERVPVPSSFSMTMLQREY